LNIDWIILCRYAEVHDNLATIAGGGIDTWWLPELPAPVQVAVAVRLLATAEELGPDCDHTTRNIIRGPDGGTLSDLSSTFKAGTKEEAGAARLEWLTGIALVAVIRFAPGEAGTYTFEHMVDGSSKSVPLHIVHGLPAGTEPSPGG
jgi:hypothetical protein